MIRRAAQGEYGVLTEISFDSKRYWEYPEEYYRVWEKELTITRDYIRNNRVYVHETDGVVTGYYAIVFLETDIRVSNITVEAGHWLEHMFVAQAFIGKGTGRRLFSHCIETCAGERIDRIGILADPFARGFYEKMGCAYIKDYPSTIAGRTTPCLVYDCFQG